MTQCPLQLSFSIAVRLQVVSFPQDLKIILDIAPSSLPVKTPIALDSQAPRNSVQKHSNFLTALKILLQSFSSLLPPPQKNSPDTFESHLCNVITSYWSPLKALFLFLRRDLQIFLQIRICLPVVGKHCLAFRDVVSVEMETSAGRSGDLHDHRRAFVPGSNWGTGL